MTKSREGNVRMRKKTKLHVKAVAELVQAASSSPKENNRKKKETRNEVPTHSTAKTRQETLPMRKEHYSVHAPGTSTKDNGACLAHQNSPLAVH